MPVIIFLGFPFFATGLPSSLNYLFSESGMLNWTRLDLKLLSPLKPANLRTRKGVHVLMGIRQ